MLVNFNIAKYLLDTGQIKLPRKCESIIHGKFYDDRKNTMRFLVYLKDICSKPGYKRGIGFQLLLNDLLEMASLDRDKEAIKELIDIGAENKINSYFSIAGMNISEDIIKYRISLGAKSRLTEVIIDHI